MSDLDLGAAAMRLARLMAELEMPILEKHGISMWEYVVLGELVGENAPTQAVLAERSGRDQTRLIRHLDRLETAGLLTRHPDPTDRRHRIVEMTAEGRKLFRSCRRAIRRMEARLLAELPGDGDVFRTQLDQLARKSRPGP